MREVHSVHGCQYKDYYRWDLPPSQVNFFSFFFQALNFLLESFGLLNDFFPFPPILDAGYPVFDLHLANVLFNVILPSVLGSSL
jgi:hypothetical protein